MKLSLRKQPDGAKEWDLWTADDVFVMSCKSRARLVEKAEAFAAVIMDAAQ